LFASGDDGVGGSDFFCSKFVPNWPASSPFVTSVGGTTLGWIEDIETAASLSGGGFSDYFSMPAYQTEAVSGYMKDAKDTLPDTTYYNITGRAYPDVSALATGFVIVVNRLPFPGVAGTSCSTPTFAGVVALLNDLRLQQGKHQLGFLNPFLYKLAVDHPDAFFDVIEGTNPGCGTDGFTAIKGWDPVTGLGSPIYETMAKYVLEY